MHAGLRCTEDGHKVGFALILTWTGERRTTYKSCDQRLKFERVDRALIEAGISTRDGHRTTAEEADQARLEWQDNARRMALSTQPDEPPLR